MSSNERVYQVFCASPSDVQKEREIIQNIIYDLNRLIWSDKKVRVEFRGWEINVTPDYGKPPQEIINDQIGEDYDILILILWSRIGSPTENYVSGTIEEFSLACDRFEKDGHPLIGIFLKNTPINHWEHDHIQLKALGDFYQQHKKNAYMLSFADDAFKNKIEDFLKDKINQLNQKLDCSIENIDVSPSFPS